jgi:hypothetical protein
MAEKVVFHYAGQDTVLAERMNFIETCKQKPHEFIAEFQSRCKYHGSKCEYNKMTNPEQELIRDRFVTGIHIDKLRAELLRHKKDDGTVVTLAEVINKAKAWEASNNINNKVMELQHTDEQVNYTSRYQQPKRWNDQQRLKKVHMCAYIVEARKPITDEPVQLVSLERIAEIVMWQITLQLSVEVLKIIIKGSGLVKLGMKSK